MKLLLLTLSLFLLSLPTFGLSQERPETIVIPVSSVGDVTETRKLILQNTLEDELKTHFRLISQDRFEEAQEKAFEELDYEECTEEQCIILIQEMLQVENVFHLQVIGEGNDTQLSLSWKTLDEKRKETDICMGCGTFQLNDKVGGLVDKMVGKKVEKKSVVVIEKSGEKILYESKKGGFVGWYKDGNEKTDGKYKGQVSGGVPNGKGTISYPDGSFYKGEYNNGFRSGLGKYTSSNGDKYVGEWMDGKRHGQGNQTWSDDGTKYVGEWKDGEITGWGKQIWGKGKWEGDVYEGEWKNGEMNGKGTYNHSNGNKYVGEYKNGKWNGQGTYTWSNGTKYVGQWKDGTIIGHGTITYSNGDKYVGEWKDGKRNGQGTMTYSNGDKYVGEWKDEIRHGQGTLTWVDGDVYEGEWKNGKKEGQGTFNFSNGDFFIGEWKKDFRWNGEEYDKKGNIIVRFVNGKWD